MCTSTGPQPSKSSDLETLMPGISARNETCFHCTENMESLYIRPRPHLCAQQEIVIFADLLGLYSAQNFISRLPPR
ncbi:hypothetical protein HBI56_110720 [Parastagonospora nodorum]|nr:hypothetical protein HBH56_043330 [Parastagonospora nodorum]KAH3932907.1 hypothetical protein HBH54_071080 [Parastagonospora nodorum]KAH3946266.1 hypothetical protein HBH53_130270 [Parastagonospora nodorum]KAH3973200.1 hypothetical protein HBH52_143160 [Parastagonospora nodorum]KAH3980711.1 hypothetical protein HBH51_049090 [Parastagonospora nodorum]